MAFGQKRSLFSARRNAHSRKRFRKHDKFQGGLLTGGKTLAKLPGRMRMVDLPGQKTLLARTLFTKMYWSVFDYLAASSGSSSVSSLRLNSIYDPGYSWSIGTKNTSSRGYSIVSPLYVSYRVYSVDVYVKVWNTANTDMLVQLCTNTNTSPSNTSDVNLVQREESSMSKILPRAANGSSETSHEFKVRCPINKILGMTKEQYRTDENTESLISSNAAATAFLHLQVWNIHIGGYIDQTGGTAGNVAQFGDDSAQITSTTGNIGFSMRIVQNVQMIQARTATAT